MNFWKSQIPFAFGMNPLEIANQPNSFFAKFWFFHSVNIQTFETKNLLHLIHKVKNLHFISKRLKFHSPMTNFYLQPPSLPPLSKNNKNKTPTRDGNLMLSKRRTFPPNTITSQKYSIYSKVQHAWQLPLIGYLLSRMQSKSQSTRVSTCLEIASWLCTDHYPTHSLTPFHLRTRAGNEW